LDTFPAAGDGIQRRCGQRPLPAVVEVALILKGWTSFPEVTSVGVGQGDFP